MARSKRQRESLPDEFDSLEAAAEFWDTHSLADFEHIQTDVEFEVHLRSEKNYFAVQKELSCDIDRLARLEGVLPETLVNFWLKEKIVEMRIQAKSAGPQ